LLDDTSQNTYKYYVVPRTIEEPSGALDFFATHPIFSREEFVHAVDPKRARSPRTLETLLAYHTRTRRLFRIRRGLYAAVPRATKPEDLTVDPLLIAAKVADDAVLAYRTALEHYGKTYSTYNECIALSEHAVRPFAFRGQRFRTVPFPCTAGRKTPIQYGLLPQERQGIAIRVTTLERTLVDLLDRPDLGGGWEEVWRSLEQVEFFAIDQVVNYAQRLGNATTTAKVGFFLEQHRESLMVEDQHLQPLRRLSPKQPHYMDPQDPTKGRLVAGWNLIVPTSILERSWEEPT
jgi:predicted transcriptional regulator of viral defense system